MYSFFKILHIITVFTSFTLFLIRGLLLMKQFDAHKNKIIKILPHINDTVLFFSAIVLMMISGQYPGIDNSWLLAKIIALLAYILLGMAALHWAKTPRLQLVAWYSALVVFIYIVHTAVTKSPIPWA